jgi:chromosome segregation ATPase
MPATSTQQEIDELKRRLESLREQAEDEIRQKLAQARQVVSELERQLSEVTGRPSASEIKALAAPRLTRVRRPPVSDEELKTHILQILAAAGAHGINAKQIATAINQTPGRLRQFMLANPGALKRVGSGPGTKYFLP